MRGFDMRRYGPVALIVFLVVTPLAIWAATSGGSNEAEDPLLVERSVGLSGQPELVLSVVADDVQLTDSADAVRVRCQDGTGKVIISATQPWPFVNEAGYDYPHAHQAAAADEVEQARRCRVLGTDKKLEAEVK